MRGVPGRLQTDYIDLYQIHRDFPAVALDETLTALTDLVRQGKVRYIGCSTFPAWRVMEALMISELRGLARFVAEQPPYNLLDRRVENELVPLCQAHRLGLIPWSPMAMGILAGRYRDAETYPADSRASLRGGIYAERVGAPGIEVGGEFVALAERAGIAPVQLAVLWVKDQPGVTAPAGWAALGRTARANPAGRGYEPQRPAPQSVRCARVAGEHGRQLPQHRGLAQGDGRLTAPT